MIIITINSLFQVIGPIMIGPSSSHTAGAVKLGKFAKLIAKEDFNNVIFNLYGSFARTYKGHGTDLALVAGILGMNEMDEDLANSFSIAEDQKIKYTFNIMEESTPDPNTVEFIFKFNDKLISTIKGVSVGGGSIRIIEIDNESINFSGEYNTLLINHVDLPGVISNVTNILYESKVNIAFMKVYRSRKGKDATMVFELDNKLNQITLDSIKMLKSITKLRFISP